MQQRPEHEMNLARKSDIRPPETRVNTATACRRGVQEGHKQYNFPHE